MVCGQQHSENGVSPFDALRCLAENRGEALTDDALTCLIEAVFCPVIRRHRDWILNTYVSLGKGGGTGSSGPHHGDTGEAGLSEGEAGSAVSGDSRDLGLEAPGGTRARGKGWQSDLVYQHAIAELWSRFSQAPSSNPATDDNVIEGDETAQPPAAGESVWEKAWRKLREQDRPSRDSATIGYLRTVAENELTAWCGGESTVYRQLRKRLTDALRLPDFKTHGGNRPATRMVSLSSVPMDSQPNHLGPSELCAEIYFAPRKGGSKYMAQPLPTPLQIADVIRQLLRTHKTSLSIETIMACLMHGWDLREPQATPLLGEELGDDLDGRKQTAKAGGNRGTIRPDHTPGPIPELPAEALAAAMEEAVVELNNGPLDPPADDRGQGKLGRLFIEYFLWMSLPVTGTESGWYGIEKYAELTGFGKSTENARFRQDLAPIVRQVVSECDADLDHDFVAALFLLRGKYLHRKPEFVSYTPFG